MLFHPNIFSLSFLVLILLFARKSEPNESVFQCSVSLNAYVNDPDDAPTNVRASPKGTVILQLVSGDDYGLTIIDANNGWFKVNAIFSFNTDDIELPNGYGWIHGSVIGLATRNYGGESIKVYAKASQDSELMDTILEETGIRPKDICGDWVKVEYVRDNKKVVGWVEKEWLCGSPVTNCS